MRFYFYLAGFSSQFDLHMTTKVCVVPQDLWITDVFSVVHREFGVELCARNRGEAGCANRVEGTVFVMSVREDRSWSGHRAGPFLVRLESSPVRGALSTGIHNNDLALPLRFDLLSAERYFDHVMPRKGVDKPLRR
jgi:hypothetical protein